ncbi:transcription elongation factor GreA [Thermanaeromonas toyohensis ToBE]|uniref:Transcription elongation factor GreA n=1 Tax=Thermanaeromonas toyohensis ToBE TaxID=698762 RepID=A0A1W1W389_9FIRM|nr:transcription elongation factor GreA [Thermanaeromonas toyohensis]SMB99953.1 transcription elongation factor GreA [Thermanaeromonas toyohensis ToBE]
MPEKEVLLTLGGLKKLEEELEYLKSVKRREVAERIKEAIGFGDLSENSEYEDAKNEQAFIEGRILALEKTLRHARVIDTQELPDNVVSLGSKVTVKDVDSGEELTYEIVGSLEADPGEMRISAQSPVGKALLGREVGTLVEIQVPDGTLRYQILSISK